MAYVVFVVVVVILFFCVEPFECCGINSVFYSIPFDVAKLSVDIIELLDVKFLNNTLYNNRSVKFSFVI